MMKDFNLSRFSVIERVHLERVRLFFGHAVGNVIAILFGAILMSLIFYSADVAMLNIAIWFGFVVLITIIVLLIEFRFDKTILVVSNARQWSTARMSMGLLLGVLYGVAPFLLPGDVRVQDEMFIFIILSAMISVASTSYSIMPFYYITLNAVTMVPLTLYFMFRPEQIHFIMVITAVIWQVIVLKNAWAVSQTSISAAYLTEELKDEMAHHLETKIQLEQMASQDSLTALPNRRALLARLDTMLAEAKRYDHPITVMFIDLDDFKKINDQYGHDAGDTLLQEVANRLKGLVRESDMVARYGGDEFVFVSANRVTNDDGLAKRILDTLAQPVVLSHESVISTYGSIGIAQFPHNGDSSEALITAADEAMYVVKKTGKSGFSLSEKQAA
jgi:diguanylate cyclase (GGDEF)-like protein